MSEDRRTIVVVLGMHRSGTSVMARALQSLGVELGDNLIPGIKGDNDKGFWEDADINQFNDTLLDTLSSAWSRLSAVKANKLRHEMTLEKETATALLEKKLTSNKLFGFKDPRFTILLPFWQSIFKNLNLDDRYIIAIRSPLNVAHSLFKRNSIPLEKGALLWAKHTSRLLAQTADKRRLVVDYDRMLDSPARELNRISNALAIPPGVADQKCRGQFENEFLSRNLRHHTFSLDDLDHSESVPKFVKDAYWWLLKLARDEISFDDVELTKFWDRYETIYGSFGPGYQYMDQMDLSLQQKGAAADFYKNESLKYKNESLEHFKDLQAEKQILKATRSSVGKLRQENRDLKGHLDQAIAERNNREDSYKLLHADYQKVEVQRNEANLENERLRNFVQEILNSRSWRLTSGLRALRRYLITIPGQTARITLSRSARAVWTRLPLDSVSKYRLKGFLFTRYRFLFQKTIAYQNWREFERSNVESVSKDSHAESILRYTLPTEDQALFVSRHDDRSPPPQPARLIAFYLPQFHAIPENDQWWGKGFTEWTNVRPAKPQFDGHYQPHVPGELGYYDLSDPEVQAQQVELAKQYGIGGFCFYFYWFAGKRLLETPILNYLAEASLDLPFCLCWANENWSRRWDGLERDILIAQKHSPQDEIAFIEYVSRYLKDNRYIRIDGRPLLLVYRPSLLPDPRETADRWRNWCRTNGVGEIYLAYTQSFETVNPARYGFDAAIEFPPNNSGPPVITNQIDTSPDFSGIIYDWRVLPERSERYSDPEYTLFRTVNTAWDNTARRKNNGAIFLGSAPAAYQRWLSNAIGDTISRFPRQDERLVFINAWNEWAEGAHLEPDQRYGYAYLQATRDALAASSLAASRRIVLVGHDAHPHGAQLLLVHMAQTLVTDLGFRVDIVLLGDGPLVSEYEKIGSVHVLGEHRNIEDGGRQLAENLFSKGIRSAITNTAVSGHFAGILKHAGFRVVTLIHELPGIIEQFQLRSHVSSIAENSDHVVFPARIVLEGFRRFADLPDEHAVTRPQGLYKRNALRDIRETRLARRQLRARLNLPQQARIIIGVGYADHRKGIDLFIDAGIRIVREKSDAYLVWVGKVDPEVRRDIDRTIAEQGVSHRFLFPGYEEDTDPYFAGADIFALTSREDPFPSVAMEAMDAALPIVAFEGAGGISELAGNGCGVLAPAFDPAAYAKAIVELLENSEKAHMLGNLGQSMIENHFSFRRYAFDLVALAVSDFYRVSVVVPNYNYASHLRERIDSILDQRYPIYELIVLDDASTDNSAQVLEGLFPLIPIDHVFVRNNTNTGSPFVQWFNGIKIAKGDLVWIAEADDLTDPRFLDEVVAPFSDDDVVLSYSQSKQMGEDGDILSPDYLDYVSDISREKWARHYVNAGRDEIREVLAIKNTIPNVSGVLFKRRILEQVLTEHLEEIRNYRVAGDWIVYVYTLSLGKVAFSPRPLNLHRRHHGSRTLSTFDISQLEEIMSIQKKIRESYKPENEVVRRSRLYSETLYELFGLKTASAPTADSHDRLRDYITGTG